jgi:hypothetical protein
LVLTCWHAVYELLESGVVLWHVVAHVCESKGLLVRICAWVLLLVGEALLIVIPLLLLLVGLPLLLRIGHVRLSHAWMGGTTPSLVAPRVRMNIVCLVHWVTMSWLLSLLLLLKVGMDLALSCFLPSALVDLVVPASTAYAWPSLLLLLHSSASLSAAQAFKIAVGSNTTFYAGSDTLPSARNLLFAAVRLAPLVVVVNTLPVESGPHLLLASQAAQHVSRDIVQTIQLSVIVLTVLVLFEFELALLAAYLD